MAKTPQQQARDSIKRPTGFDPSKVKVIKKVTRPLLKWTVDVPRYVTFLSEIYKGKDVKGTKEGAVMEPADLVEVRNLEDGEEYQMIVGAVLHANLREAYKDKSYVGKHFMLVQRKIEGKKYKGYEITEIALDGEDGNE